MDATLVGPLLVRAREAQNENGGTVTIKSSGINRVDFLDLVSNDLLAETGEFEKTGKRGRPARLYKLTRKGRDRARRFEQDNSEDQENS